MKIDIDMLKRLIFLLMLLLAFNRLSAAGDDASIPATQDSINVSKESDDRLSRNLFFELGGPSLGVGIGYDQRFKPNSVFGFRAGIAFADGSCDDGGWWGAWSGRDYTEVDFKGVTLPLEVNAIMGKRASKFELGIGATPCVLTREETRHCYCSQQHHFFYRTKGVKLNIFGTLNVGYRLQRESGFFLRTGLTFRMGELKCSPLDGLVPALSLSLGYTIQ